MGGTVEQENDSIYTLVFKAFLEPGWHLYSQEEVAIDIAPIPTEFSYSEVPGKYELIGATEEPDVPPLYDAVFEADITYFEDEAEFRQKIKVLDPTDLVITAEVYFSVCDDEKCLPPETERFTMSLEDKNVVEGFTDLEVSDKDQQLTEALNIDVKGVGGADLEEEESSNYSTIFFLGFIGGLIAFAYTLCFPNDPSYRFLLYKGRKNPKKRTG